MKNCSDHPKYSEEKNRCSAEKDQSDPKNHGLFTIHFSSLLLILLASLPPDQGGDVFLGL